MNNNKKEEAEDDNFIIEVILNFSCKEAPKVTLTLNNLLLQSENTTPDLLTAFQKVRDEI